MLIANPVLAQAYQNDWYYPWVPPKEIIESPEYQHAVEGGWHEWVESPLDFEAMRNGYVYDQSYDVDHRPCYWFDGGWILHDGTKVSVHDEQHLIGHVGKGDVMMRFCETFLRHTKYPLEGKPYRFLPWMRKVCASVFGWVHVESGYRRFQDVYIAVAKKNGKLLHNDTPVPTPDGWKKHGDLRVGDKLFDRHGNQCEVIAVHPKGVADYEVEFTNGEKIKCNGEHLWVTETLLNPGGKKAVYDTGEKPTFETGCLYCGDKVYAKQLCNRHYQRELKYGFATAAKFRACKRSEGGYYPLSEKTTIEISETTKAGNALNHRIPLHDGLDCEEKGLPIDPWILGLWLGDGSKGSGNITCHKNDFEYEKGQIENLGYKVSDLKQGKTYAVYGLRKKLHALGVLHNKHIPPEYLRASRSQRIALLQGLMDADGTISKRATDISFTQKSKQMANGVCELLATLGLKYTCKLKEKTCTNSVNGPKKCSAYHIQFGAFRDTHPVFRMPRKLSRMRWLSDLQMSTGRCRHVHIKEIRKIEPEEGNCITVSSPDGTYLCGNTMLPTHNSALMSVIGIYMLLADGTPRAQVYTCACDRNQARIIFDESAHMVRLSPEIGNIISIVDSRGVLAHVASGSQYKVLSADAHRNDGLDSSCTLVDEIHRHPNRKLFTVMLRAGTARPEPLMFTITTYGPSLSDGSIWAEIHNEAHQLMLGNRPKSWQKYVMIASAEPIQVSNTELVEPGSTRIPVRRLLQPVDCSTVSFEVSEFAEGVEEQKEVKVHIVEPAKRFQDYLVVKPIEDEIPPFSEATANLEWRDEHAVRRANPSVDTIFPMQRILKQIEESRTPETEAETKQLNLNIVAGSGRKWISSAAWQACGKKFQVQPKKLIDRPCYGGLDISFGNDLIGFGLAFPSWSPSEAFETVDKPRVDLLTWAWIPTANIEEREEVEQFPYRHYANKPYLLDKKGCIRLCHGAVIDFNQVAEEIIEICRLFEVLAIAYDPNYASFVIPILEEEGIVCVAHRQGAVSMSPPCKRFAEGVYSGWIAHGHNPVLDRAVEGAVLHKPDKAGNTYLSKGDSHARIDPLVADVMAVGYCCDPPVGADDAYSDSSTGMWG